MTYQEIRDFLHSFSPGGYEDVERAKLLRAQASEKSESFSDIIGRINEIFGNAQQPGQNQDQGTPGISRLDAIRMAAKAKYGIEIPKTEEELKKERKGDLINEIDKKELMSMAQALPKLEQALQSVNQLEALFSEGASPDDNPLVARATGPLDVIKARSGFNPKLNSYLNNRKAFAGLIAKGGFGEAGMLTNQDIERVVAALPSASSTPEEASIGFKEIRSLLKSARDRFESKKAAYMSDGSSGDKELAQGKELDADTAREFLQQAGGDKDKARELARAAGYTF